MNPAMAQRFKNLDRSTPVLLPPDRRDWVAEDDQVHFVIGAVERLPLSTPSLFVSFACFADSASVFGLNVLKKPTPAGLPQLLRPRTGALRSRTDRKRRRSFSGWNYYRSRCEGASFATGKMPEGSRTTAAQELPSFPFHRSPIRLVQLHLLRLLAQAQV